MATISGTNTGIYKGCLVRAYARDSGAYAGSAFSDASTGVWSITVPYSGLKYFAVCHSVPGDPYEKYRVFGCDFNGANGGTIATDIYGRALTWESVTLSNAQAITGTTSVGAFGSGNRVKTPKDSKICAPAGTAMTLEAWVYPTSTPASDSFVFGEDIETPYTGLSFGFSGANTRINVPNSGAYTGSGASVNVNAWNHLGFVIRTNGYVLQFLNGTLTSSNNFGGDVWVSANNICIGSGRYGGSAAPFSGYVDSVSIYQGLEKWTSSFTAPASPSPIDLAAAGEKALIFDDVTPV